MAENSHIAGGNRRPVQKVRVKTSGWTKARREKFLKVLAETCNVSMASEATGATGSPYALRRRDPAFAKLWDEALAVGYAQLEAKLLQRALEGVNDIDLDALLDAEAEVGARNDREDAAGAGQADGEAKVVAEEPRPARTGRHRGLRGHHRPGSGIAPSGVARDDMQLALALLNRRREGQTRTVAGRKLMTSEEVDEMLLKKLDNLARKLEQPK